VTYQPEVPGTLAQPPPERRTREPWWVRRDLLAAAWIVGALVVVGALLGLLWQWVSPRTVGLVLPGGGIVPDETEGFVGADGWFAGLTLGVGLVAPLVVWSRRGWRGPVAVAALAVGGLAGAAATALVGRLTGGGRSGGPVNAVIRLPVSVHAWGLLCLEGAAAVLVYGLLVAFAAGDDLGRDGGGRPAEPDPLSSPPA
jgi:Protein of unknown function (DUF2567)